MTDLRAPAMQATSHSAFLPDIKIPPAKLIGGPSRFSNIYAPAPEVIHLEQELIRGQQATVTIRHGCTKSLTDYRGAGRRARLHSLLSRVTGSPKLHMGERVVYDARWVYNGNLAHLFGHHLGNLGYVKSVLGLDAKSVLVILEKNSPKLSHKLFSFVGYETVETDGVVEANVLSVDFDHTENYHLVPYIRLVEPSGFKPVPGPTRLFIPRRTSRRIKNEAEVLALCRERNYEPVYFEDIPLSTQWSLVQRASSIVAIHGAALGLLNTRAHAQPGTDFELLEIFSPGLVADCYRKITAMVGGRWIGCRGDVTSAFVQCVEESANYKAMDAADFHLNVRSLDLAFQKLSQAS